MDWATFDGGENKVRAAPFKELLFKFVLEELGDLDGASRVLGLQRASLWRADVGSELFNKREPCRGEGPDFAGAGQTARLDAAQELLRYGRVFGSEGVCERPGQH